MQTILGAGGQIADELARYLHDEITEDLRLVSRKPVPVHETDQLCPADLTDADATNAAVRGSEIAYFTAGLPIDSTLWEQLFPVMMGNAIAAAERHGSRLVFFDNTYMYPRTADPQTEDTAFAPVGRKAIVRARIAEMLLTEMDAGRIEAVICRAPEFYGPDKTQSLTNSAVFDRIKQRKRPLIPVSAHTRRSLIWTPDASRAMAVIANSPDSYGQTWHLPVDPHHLTYAEIVATASTTIGERVRYTTIPDSLFRLAGCFNSAVKEASELLPRYRVDNIFDSAKFTTRYPDFEATSNTEGISALLTKDQPLPL